MRSASRIFHRSGVALLLVFLGTGVPIPLIAQQPGPAYGQPESRDSNQIDPHELTLHHPREDCGKKWVKKLGALTDEEFAWMAHYHHGLYEVVLDGRILMTIEILNTPNLRNCELDQHWKTREMTIRVTYFLFDGSKTTQLTYTAMDETYVNQAPRVYPLLGKALLIGIDAEGNARSKWLALEPFKALYAEAAGRQSEEYTVLASH
jgi:hypothetical protein